MTPLLLLALPLIEGETAASYTSRTAAMHETVPRDLCSDLGMLWAHLCSGHSGQLDRLAWLTGFSLDRLMFWNPQRVGIGRYKVGFAHSSTGAFRRTATRVCPHCVEEAIAQQGPSGIFQLLEWSVTSLHSCGRHGAALLTLPPARTSHENYDVVRRVLLHRTLVIKAADRAEKLEQTLFEAYCRSRIYQGPRQDLMAGMELTHIHRTCLTLGVMLEKRPLDQAYDLLRDAERQACQAGFEVLSKGSEALLEALDKLRSRNAEERPYFSTGLGVFYTWLKSTLDCDALSGLKSHVRSFIFGNYPVKPGKIILGRRPAKETWITFDKARKQSGIGLIFLRKLLQHLDGLTDAQAQAVNDLKPSDLDRIIRFRRTLCNIKETAGRLNIHPVQVKSLVRLGVLNNLSFGSAFKFLYKPEVEAIADAAGRLPLMQPGSGHLPIKTFCRDRRCHLANVIAAWLNGELTGLALAPEGDGLQRLLIPADAACGKPRVALGRDLTIPEAARYLRISNPSIRVLRDAGYLKQIVKLNPETNHSRSYISQVSIRAFERSYVTLGQLAEKDGASPIHLARKFDRGGIEPVGLDAGRVRVYDRCIVLPGASKHGERRSRSTGSMTDAGQAGETPV